MKRIPIVLLTAFLTGVVTLTGYKVFFEKPQVTIIKEDSAANIARMTAHLPEAGFDFVDAAEYAMPTVVHVKTAVQKQRRPMKLVQIRRPILRY